MNWLKKIIITIRTKHKNRTSKKGKGGFEKEGNLGEWKEKQNYDVLDNVKRQWQEDYEPDKGQWLTDIPSFKLS